MPITHYEDREENPLLTEGEREFPKYNRKLCFLLSRNREDWNGGKIIME